MSLSSALSVALTGLQVSSTMLQLTSDNISNANTAGYTTKAANLTSIATGGVEIANYTRATNNALTLAFGAATSSASYFDTQNTYMQQVQAILGSNANNPPLSDAIAKFAAAWTQLQASPEDPTVQETVVQAGNNFAKQINTIAAQVGTFQTQVRTDIQNTVSQLNTDLASIASFNQQIVTANSNHQPTGNLEDQRDQLVNKVAAITNVQTFQRNQGQIALYTPDGVSLLDGTPQVFSYNSSTGVVSNSNGVNVTNDLIGGSLQAGLQFNATTNPPSSLPGVNTIQKLQGQLKDLVTAFTNGSAFATAYNPGGVTANDFFQATSNDPGTFAVTSSLITDPTTLSQTTATATAATFTANNTYTDANAGLSVTGTYADLVGSILSSFQQAANTISNQNQTTAQQKTYYQQSLSNATGVNIDTELVNLTNLQNSYAASAHVINTITQMFNDLISTIA